jgi:hypothetical protein
MLDRSHFTYSATPRKCPRKPATRPTPGASSASRPGAAPWRAS